MLGGKSDLLPIFFVVIATIIITSIVLLLGTGAWIVIILGGVMLSGLGAYHLYATRQSLQWKQTLGTITLADIAEYSVAESEYTRQTYYYPTVEFTYTVNGREHKSTQVALDIKSIWSPDKQAIDQILKKWTPQTQVTVYADPSKPENAVLIPGLSRYRRSHYAALLIAGILLAMAGYGVHLLKAA